MTNKVLHISFFIVISLGFSIGLFAQEDLELARKGNRHYEAGDYDKAEEFYDKALKKNPERFEAKFNKGDALYRQKKFQDAVSQFERIANMSEDRETRSKAWHNAGNSYLQAGKLEESIEAYKKALRNDPTAEDTRYNLAYAQKKLKKRQKRKKQQKKDQQKKKQNKQDQKQQKGDQKKDKKQKGDRNKRQKGDQRKNDQGGQDQQKKEKRGDSQQKQGQKDKKEGKARKKKPNELSKQDAMRLLKALDNQERLLQKQIERKKRKGKETESDKDW